MGVSLPTVAALVDWYRAHARVLPWRTSASPYRTLLSEFMLQQTRVDTVLPYFARFVDKWPTVESLAAADEDEVLKLWAGLGYYSRARNLHRAAQSIASAGTFPRDPDALAKLPGIGPYTAGAVASIAFDVAAPAVDGNVERVIARAVGLELDVRSAAGRSAIAAEVRRLFVGARPSEVTQALMELGATVCSPRNPRCDRCPWSSSCASTKDPEALPNKPKKAAPVPVRAVAGLLSDDGRLLMGRRPKGLLGGLWEPVSSATFEAGEPARVLKTAFRERVGVEVVVGPHLGAIVHVFSHRRLTLDVYEVAGDAAEARCLDHYDDMALVDPEADTVALSALARRTIALWRSPTFGLLAAEPDRCLAPPSSSSGTKSSRANSRTRTGRT